MALFGHPMAKYNSTSAKWTATREIYFCTLILFQKTVKIHIDVEKNPEQHYEILMRERERERERERLYTFIL